MFKYIFTALLALTTTQANAGDWDKIERAADKALEQTEEALKEAADDVEDVVNEVDDDVEAFLEKPETKKFIKRVEVNSKRVLRSIEEGVRHFGREVRQEFEDDDQAATAEPLVPVVIKTNSLTLLRGISDPVSFKAKLRTGAYYFSMNGESFSQIIPLQPGTDLKVVPTSEADTQFAYDAVNSLNEQGEIQYCVDTDSFEIVDTLEVVAIHVFSECSVTQVQ